MLLRINSHLFRQKEIAVDLAAASYGVEAVRVGAEMNRMLLSDCSESLCHPCVARWFSSESAVSFDVGDVKLEV